jgi:hypothetical protein
VAEDAVYPPGVDVAVYEVIPTVFPDTGAVNVTSARPLLYALFAPTFVAEAPVGASGAIKLSCAAEVIPIFLFAIFISYFLIIIKLRGLRQVPKYLSLF